MKHELFDFAQVPSYYFILTSVNQLSFNSFDTLCISLLMSILAESSYWNTILGVTDASAAPDPEEAQVGEEETEKIPLGLDKWLDNGPM